jgi:hypothetical protein
VSVAGDVQTDLAHATRRMLQALDAYWRHYEGVDPSKRPDGSLRWPHGRYDAEDWWNKFEMYRARVEEALRG